MKLEYLYAYKNLKSYYDASEFNAESWSYYMLEPYWNRIAEWAFDSTDHLKPKSLSDSVYIKRLVEVFADIKLDGYKTEFERIVSVLPKDDDDPMVIAFYPSDTSMLEGIYGTNVWGNIILNLNPCNERCFEWIPFVFAHEYHHNVLGFYWYCIKGGKETTGSLLESIINEGEADAFAQSLYTDKTPSWHSGVLRDEEPLVWAKFKNILDSHLSIDETSAYMFGSKEKGIPKNSGYYFGINIVKDFLEKHPKMSFSELIQVPHKEIYLGSGYGSKF